MAMGLGFQSVVERFPLYPPGPSELAEAGALRAERPFGTHYEQRRYVVLYRL